MLLPVVMITAMAVPDTTLVPMNRMLSRSRGLSVSRSCWRGNFSTGIDSPVMAAWLTNRSLALSTRQSAGIMSPADSTIRSPGTSCLIGNSIRCALWSSRSRRITVAVLLTIALRASAAWLDLVSCQKRSKVESTTMEKITMAAFMSSVSQEMTASSVSSRLNGFL
ncbi:hypothetical protein D3C78_886450 [compost metagenome]